MTTQKGNTVYVHVLDWPDEVLALPALPRPVKRALLLNGGAPVAHREVEGGVVLGVPRARRDAIDTAVLET